jgi:hypothetical protein
MFKMVKIETVSIETREELDEKYHPIYQIGERKNRWFNLNAVQTVYEWHEEVPDKPVSLVQLANGSFLVEGTPEEVSEELMRLAKE